jgi:hypothetical protein
MTRCIAFQASTGDRCRRRVGKHPLAQHLKLCRTHGRSVWLCLRAEDVTTLAFRERLAQGRWTNYRELRK